MPERYSVLSGILTMNKGYIYLGLTTLIFGTFEVVSKMIHGIEATQLNFLRFFIGGISLLPFAVYEIRKNNLKLNRKDLLQMTGLGVLFVPVSMVLLQIAIQKTSASLSTFVFSSNPIFIAVFAFLLLKEKPNRYILLSIAFGIVGLGFIANPFNSYYSIYVLYPIFAAVIFSVYNVLMRKTTKKFGNLVSTTLVVIFGTIVLGIILTVNGIALFKGINMGNILLLVYLGMFCSGITYVSYYKGMELTSTNVGSIVFFFKPILGTIFAVIVLSEKLTANFIFGAALITFGSVIMIYGKEKIAGEKQAVNNQAKAL